MLRKQRLFGLALLLVIVGWLALPAARAAWLVERHGGLAIVVPHDLPVQAVRFRATDGVQLRGWFVPSHSSAKIILVPGFKNDRMSMLPYARFLHAAGYGVLLYDSRDTGQSSGHFSVGAGEVQDVLGAISFLSFGHGPGNPPLGLLGVSLGAGDVIVAAAISHRVGATVADSPYTDQDAVVAGLNQIHIVGPVNLPLAPVSASVIDRLAHVTLSSFRPIDRVGKVAPAALLLIHSAHDANSTTPLAGVLRLRRAARSPVELWIAPLGGHADALAAQPREYRRRVLTFFDRYFLHHMRP